jgi:hypothetical protein
VLTGWYIDRLNRRAVRQYLLPLKNEKETLLGGAPEPGAQP